jgi:hypothetical protein
MSTGACGIDCSACRLNAVGLCSSCGSGKSAEAQAKIAAQIRILGGPCPILACAVKNQLDYCLKDCFAFPCERFSGGPYPFSEGFLMMQERRRKDMPQGRSPVAQAFQVPVQYWEDLLQRDMDVICRNAIAEFRPVRGLVIPFLNETYLVDGEERCLKRPGRGGWETVDHPLLALILLVYILGAKDVSLKNEMITVQQLKDGHFFQGPHELNTRPLLMRYGRDAEGFRRAAAALGGASIDAADAAFRIQALPRVPLYYLLWEGDEEFGPRLSILFDRSVEMHLSADGIWGLVQLVSTALVQSGKGPDVVSHR